MHHLQRAGAPLRLWDKRYTDPFGNCEHPGRDHFGKEFELSCVQLEYNPTLFRGSQNRFIRIKENLARAGGSR
jgi:hypothetical protein